MSKWTIQDDDGSAAICIDGEPVFWFDPEHNLSIAEQVRATMTGPCEHVWRTASWCVKCGRASQEAEQT